MDNEMIERVIKASFDCWAQSKPGKQDYTVDDMDEEEREFARRHAIAIIKAMREPTAKMLVAVENYGWTEGKSDVEGIWQDMIDAIIGD